MTKFGPNIETSASLEATAELRQLLELGAVNAELIHSLTGPKKEARAHLKFYKRMMYLSNGLMMFIGLAIAGFSGLRLQGGFSGVALIGLIIGLLLFAKLSAVFMSMFRGLRAVEEAARKHELI